MTAIGKILLTEVKANKDGIKKSLLAQTEITDPNDLQTVELIGHSGIDSNPFFNSSNVVVIEINKSWRIGIAVNDGIESECKPGEIEIYSHNGKTKLAKLRCNLAGEVVLNDGTDYATLYNKMKAAFDQLKAELNAFITLYNTHVHPGVTAGAASTTATISLATASSADMTAAQALKVRI